MRGRQSESGDCSSWRFKSRVFAYVSHQGWPRLIFETLPLQPNFFLQICIFFSHVPFPISCKLHTNNCTFPHSQLQFQCPNKATVSLNTDSITATTPSEATMGSFKKEASRRVRDGTDKGGVNFKIKG